MSAIRKTGQPDPKTIVILRALQLGDMLNTVPAFRALRAAFPDSRITLVGLPWAMEFVEQFRSYLDDFIALPGYPGLLEQSPNIKQFPSFLRWMQAMGTDLALQMHGSGEISNPLISLWGARQCAGFYLPGHYCPDKVLFLEYPEHESEIWRHLRLMEFLGIPLRGDDLEFPLFDKDWTELHRLRETFDLKQEYVCVHPGASKQERRWPTRFFAGVADGLAAHGFQIVLTGTSGEADLTASVARQMKHRSIDLAGKTSLGAVAALISKSHLVVSNDTGISHVATAVKTPSVILFSVPDMDRWAPKNTQLHKIIWPAKDATIANVLAQAERHLQETYERPFGIFGRRLITGI